MRLEKILGFHVLRIVGPKISLIFDNVDNHKHIIDSKVLSRCLDRVDDWSEECALNNRRVWLLVFGVLIHDSDQEVGLNSLEDSDAELEGLTMRKFIGELIDFGRGRGLSQSSNSVKEVFLGDKDDFVQGLEPDLPVCDGFASIEGSKIEFVACKGCRHKVRHMVDVIHSMLSPEEKIHAA
ncbi:hypothetical protein V6N12_050165 [Hibiscus sabdariffa]|uniref:Uncharacterized protein n=1 Tax=Hibiscus sabdariffa TaxID=183260 RepID=A0ABR2GBP1_9ROSI